MKKAFTFFMVIATCWQAHAQILLTDLSYQSALEESLIKNYQNNARQGYFKLLIAADETMTDAVANEFNQEIDLFLEKYNTKITSNQIQGRYLSQLFYKVHRKYLKRYVQYSSLSETIQNGNYDCLSGTSLYAVLLEKLNVPFQIVETNYHIYLKIETKNGTVLMESTDPLNGYIDNKNEVASRMGEIESDQEKLQEGQYAFEFNINQIISMDGLVGLQYFNQAVDAFNHQKFDLALIQLEKANVFYSSERIIEFGELIGRQIIDSNKYSYTDKSDMISRINKLLNSEVTVASR